MYTQNPTWTHKLVKTGPLGFFLHALGNYCTYFWSPGSYDSEYRNPTYSAYAVGYLGLGYFKFQAHVPIF